MSVATTLKPFYLIRRQIQFTRMPCDACGHSKAAHREMTLSVYFCSQCQKVESHVTFPPDKPAQAETHPGSADDMLSELYYNGKAFRKN
jgi:hypothetical protein